jgi:hypothetical protein
MEYTIACAFCSGSVPCTKPDCAFEAAKMRAATESLNLSFQKRPLRIGLIPDAQGINQDRHMREAAEMLYDAGAL